VPRTHGSRKPWPSRPSPAPTPSASAASPTTEPRRGPPVCGAIRLRPTRSSPTPAGSVPREAVPGAAARSRGGGVRGGRISRRPLERLRARRPVPSRVQPAAFRLVGDVACLREVLVGERVRRPVLPAANGGDGGARRPPGRGALVPPRERLVARGPDRDRRG